MSGHYFEDLELGERHEIGSETLTAEAIIDFASKYDPQPFHLSEEGGRDSLFGGLCASGFHVTALWMSKIVPYRAGQLLRSDDPVAALAAQGPSPGALNVRWHLPALAGDTLTFFYTPNEKLDWKKPGWGLMRSKAEVFNQKDELVCSFIGQGLVRKRPDSREAG